MLTCRKHPKGGGRGVLQKEVGVRQEASSMLDHKVMLLQVQVKSKGVKTGVEETRKYQQAGEKRIWKWCYKQN